TGKLPTPQQWDRAAGYPHKDDAVGPFDGTWDDDKPVNCDILGVRRRKEGPAAIPQTADLDSKSAAVRGLAGNGREFTSWMLKDHEMIEWREKPEANDLIILRGRSYTAPRPLFYADLDAEKQMPQTQFYSAASPFTGFRIVVDLH